MTADEVLAAVGEANERMAMLDEKLQQAMSDPGSEAISQLHQEIAEARARKDWLLGRVHEVGTAMTVPTSTTANLIG